ncbi:MAG: hypothetical protein ABEI75_02500 [Halobaculum sp.]
MKSTWKTPLAVLAVFGVIAATVVAPAEPPGGGSWGAVVGGVLAAAVGLGGLALTWYGGSMLYTVYSFRDREADSAVRVADGGPVRVEGTARPHEETLTAPVTGRECLAHTYAVEHRVGGGGGSRETTTDDHTADSGNSDPAWIDSAEGTEVVPFVVETDDGAVLVDGDPTLTITDDRTQTIVGGNEDPPDGIATFLETPDVAAAPDSTIDLSGLDRDRTLRYTENVIVLGETVFVVGDGETGAGSSHEVDAVVTRPTEGVTARLPDWLWRYDFYLADKPMDEMVTAMRQLGVLAVIAGIVGLAVAGVFIV